MNSDNYEATDGVIETNAARISLRQDGIVHLVIKPGSEITSEEANEILTELVNLIGGRSAFVLADIRGIRSADREARKYPKSASGLAGLAVRVGTSISTTIGNFFLRLDKPPYPTRLFNSESKAIEWLRSLQT